VADALKNIIVLPDEMELSVAFFVFLFGTMDRRFSDFAFQHVVVDFLGGSQLAEMLRLEEVNSAVKAIVHTIHHVWLIHMLTLESEDTRALIRAKVHTIHHMPAAFSRHDWNIDIDTGHCHSTGVISTNIRVVPIKQ